MTARRVVHFEIPAQQPGLLSAFYKELFGWKLHRAVVAGEQHWFCDTGSHGPGINGAILKRRNPGQAPTFYVLVPSIDATLTGVAKLGGVRVVPRTAVPGMGAFATFRDPDGNVCGLWESTEREDA